MANYIRLPGEPPPRYDTPMGRERNAEAKERMAARAPKPAGPKLRSAGMERIDVEEAAGMRSPENAKAMKKLVSPFSVRDYSVPGDPHR